jgi:hypothetical protein
MSGPFLSNAIHGLTLLLATAAPAAVDFNRQVRPLLSDRCFACHGPDSAKREAGLRLDTPEGATSLLKSGFRAIDPEKPANSEILKRLHATDPDDIMPPPKLHRPLSAAEKEILEAWIRSGAKYEKHWAFLPPQAQPLPAVKDTTWPRCSIDRFILAHMEASQLAPAPEASRATLLRRASFVLAGLPPSPDQLAAFAADPAPDAFEKQVDALLASPRFGERMAQDWLDIARFADTYGYQSDNTCFVWPWRDWVIKAFNENLPYDQFLTWQIAGDLLPDATQEQRLATMFNRLHRQTQEGGSIEQEFRQEYVSDRVHTAGTAFLGLTLECSKCHDHKYDPLSQKDYYSMAAMFGQIDENGLYPYSISTSAPEPSMALLPPGSTPELKKRQAALSTALTQASNTATTRTAAFDAWLAATTTLATPAPSEHYTLDAIADGKLANSGTGPDLKPASMSGGQLTPVPGAIGGAMEFDGDTTLALDGVSGITRHMPLSISLRLWSPDKKPRALLLHTGPGMFSQMADAAGFELLLEDGKLRWSCIHLWPGCAASIESIDDFPINQWVEVTVTYDGSSQASGLKLYHEGQPIATRVRHDTLNKNITTETMRLGARPRDDRGFAKGRMDDIKIFRHLLSPLEVADLHQPVLTSILAAAKAGPSGARSILLDHYLARLDPEMAKARAAVTAARQNLEDDFLGKSPLIMVMQESPTPRQFHVLTRGDYASPDLKQPVSPAPPRAVMPFPDTAPRNRLGLARWMTHPDNPLVSRVAVNRLWMMCFGTGIVATQENFGQQGDAPSHQELLDTLASEFSQSGWDVKQLLRRMVLSATFRQDSSATREKRDKDPLNRLLARGPSYRLSGEAIRDQALFAAGLLMEKIGGPSVKPWQPAGVWSEAGASGGDYTPDTGEGLHRRSLYTFRKRTAPPPGMLTLDAGSREICQPRRLTTNTPLQPLIFLNDQSFFECARLLAARAIREQPANVEAQLQRAFLLLTSRTAAPPELAALTELHTSQLQHFTAEPAAAKAVALTEDPALAALTIVCSTLLTSDAALTNR